MLHRCFRYSDVVEIFDGIIFDFYVGLLHMAIMQEKLGGL